MNDAGWPRAITPCTNADSPLDEIVCVAGFGCIELFAYEISTIGTGNHNLRYERLFSFRSRKSEAFPLLLAQKVSTPSTTLPAQLTARAPPCPEPHDQN